MVHVGTGAFVRPAKRSEAFSGEDMKKANYVGLGVALGAALGIGVGVVSGHLAIWLPVGIAIGVAVGGSLGRRKLE
jgi:hypothetical protein